MTDPRKPPREVVAAFARKVQPYAKFTPSNCPHCEYDRRFPGFESGGWMQQDNNGPIVSCPMCNDDGSHPRAETV